MRWKGGSHGKIKELMNCGHAGQFPRLVDTGVVGWVIQGRVTRLWFGREADYVTLRSQLKV